MRQIPPEIKESLQTTLYSRAGHTFLWVEIILSALEQSSLLSVSELRTFVERIPENLEMTYLRFVSSIRPDHLGAASKLLKLILGSSRSLSLDEINPGFSIHHSYRTVEGVKENYQAGMQRTLQNILGPLVRVSDSRVSLVHQSVKDFILQQRHRVGEKDSESPLSWATRDGCREAVLRLLKDSRVDRRGGVDKDGRNAISWACGQGHTATARIFVERKCPGIDEPDNNGWAPLAWAVQNNAPEMVDILVAHAGPGSGDDSGPLAVDLERVDSFGRTALSWAVEYGHVEVVRALLRAGADPDAKGARGIDPKTAGLRGLRRTKIVELLESVNP